MIKFIFIFKSLFFNFFNFSFFILVLLEKLLESKRRVSKIIFKLNLTIYKF